MSLRSVSNAGVQELDALLRQSSEALLVDKED